MCTWTSTPLPNPAPFRHAAPARVGTLAPNVPLLALYLARTIAAMTGVARMRQWPWLAIAALAGGAGWSLWMIAIGGALDTLGSLSIGGYILLLGVAGPLLEIGRASCRERVCP